MLNRTSIPNDDQTENGDSKQDNQSNFLATLGVNSRTFGTQTKSGRKTSLPEGNDRNSLFNMSASHVSRSRSPYSPSKHDQISAFPVDSVKTDEKMLDAMSQLSLANSARQKLPKREA